MSDDTPSQREDAAADKAERESPGRLLQAARKRKGLSLDELVGQTMLSRSTLAALEADDFGQLSQPVYVRGYYRKCAKVLDLSEDELINAYAEHADVSEPRPASPGQMAVIPQDVTPRSWRWVNVLWGTAAIIALLAVAWWLLPRPDQGAAAAGGNADTLRQALPLLDDGSKSAPQTETAPETAPAEPGEGLARLQFRVKQRSWVEVRDAGGERLFADMLSAGSERTVVGQPPYEVVLGNAPGVEVRLNGERVAFGDRIRDNKTARLTVAPGAGE